MAPPTHLNPAPEPAFADIQTALHIPSDPAVPLSVKPLGFSSTRASVLLDCLRGLAAVLVMIGHARNLFFLDYSDLAAHRWLYALPYLVTSAGHQAVIIFFVMSGYLISGSVFRMFRQSTWTWRTYLLQRLVRLWIVLLPGLLLCTVFDLIGRHLPGLTPYNLYHGLANNHIMGDSTPSFNLRGFFGNLFFLQVTLVDVFGTDSPLWSLAYEFWYYMLFPLGLLALRRQTRLPERILSVVLFAAILRFVDITITALFPVWLFGTVMALLPQPRLQKIWRTVATILYVPSIFAFGKLPTHHPFLADTLFGLITFAYLYVLLSAREPSREGSLTSHLWRTLARFSYTLYVVHLPFLVLLAALTLGATRWKPDVLHVVIVLAYLALAVALSYGLASVTEFRTDKLRKAIERRLPGASQR